MAFVSTGFQRGVGFLVSEEDEYLWFGSVFKLTLQNVFRVAENKGSTKCVRAFWFFDAILSETFHERDEKNWTDYIKKALDFCIQYTLDSNTDVFRPNKVDQFALDNWYCFCQKKTKMVVNLRHLGFMEEISDLLFFGVSEYDEHEVVIPEDETNIFRPELFEIFPNLTEIELKTGSRCVHPMNLKLMLSVLDQSDLPQDFKLKIKDHNNFWIEKLSGWEEMKDEYAANEWKMEFKEIEDFAGWTAPWLMIERM